MNEELLISGDFNVETPRYGIRRLIIYISGFLFYLGLSRDRITGEYNV
jgi:hypothetical protein